MPHSITQWLGKPERWAALLRGRRLRLPRRIASGSWQSCEGEALNARTATEVVLAWHPPFGPCWTARFGRDFFLIAISPDRGRDDLAVKFNRLQKKPSFVRTGVPVEPPSQPAPLF